MKGTWILGAMLWLVVAPAAAQQVHLRVQGEPEPQRLRDALAAELERPVLLDVEGEPSLQVRVGPGLATLVYSAAGGEVRVREIEVVQEPDARRAELVLVASNLLRDQASDLIVAAAVPEASPAPELQGSVPGGEAPSFATTHPLHLGVTLRGGLLYLERPVAPGTVMCVRAPCPGTETVADFGGDLSLSLMGQVVPSVALGLRGLTVGFGYSSLEGTIFSLTLAPTVELGGFVDRHVQLFAQLGFPVQGRTQSPRREEIFQVATALRAGVRLWPVDWFSIDLEIDTRMNWTEGFVYAGYELPQLSSVTTIGLNAGFHIAP